LATLLSVACLAVSGCGGTAWDIFPLWKGFLDPTATVAAGEESDLSPILSALDPMDEWRETVRNAESPTLADLEWSTEDYKIGPGDVVTVTILNLFTEGVETPFQRMVSNEGFIELPLLADRLPLTGLNADEARQAIVDAYEPDFLINPTVSLLLAGKRQNVFSIIGPVARPNSYPIPRRDYRLLRALTDAGDVVQRNIRYVYIFRPQDEEGGFSPPVRTRGAPTVTPGTLPPMPGTDDTKPSADEAERRALEELRRYMESRPSTTPPTPPTGPTGPTVVPVVPVVPTPPTGPVVVPEVPTRPSVVPVVPTRPSGEGNGDIDELRRIMPGVAPKPITRPVKPTIVRMAEMTGRPGASATTAPASTAGAATPPATDPDDPFGYAQADLSKSVRIIAVDLRKLKEGDPRQNIIVRDGDMIVVPTVTFGEFYVMGQVARPGVYDLSGRRVTAKMALGAAGGLTAVGWPSNTVLIRRIGSDQELRIPLRLDLIMAGKEPDVMLKPDDVIAVGTHMAAPFLAVARNAFRMTYGLGFIYDRNFADKNFGQYNGLIESVRFFR